MDVYIKKKKKLFGQKNESRIQVKRRKFSSKRERKEYPGIYFDNR